MKLKMKSLLVAVTAGVITCGQALAQDIAVGLKELDANRGCNAKDIFEKAGASGTADGLFNYGYYLLRTRQPDLAKAAFEKGFAVDPKNQLNKVGLGAVALAKGDRAGAKLAMDEAVKNSKGKDVNVLFRAGEAYSGYVAIDSLKSTYKATDPAEAIKLLDMAVALMIKNKQEIADVYMAKGDAFFTKGESGAAVSAYEDAVRVNPNNAKAIAKIGKIYWGGKNLPLAQENFKKAIELDPDYAPAVHEYAELQFYVRQYKNAAKTYNTYLDGLKGCVDEENVLRSAQFDFIAEDNAKVLEKITKLSKSTNPILMRMEGWSSYKQNQYDRAIEKINGFLAKAPEKAMMNDYKYLGNSVLRGTNPDTAKAVSYLEKAAAMDTVDNGYKEIASFYQTAKKYRQARDFWIKAIKREPKYASTDLYQYAQAQYQYANSIMVTGTGADSAALRAERRNNFLTADSLFVKYIERKADFLPVYNSRARANYYAYSREEALENGKCIPHMEKYIQMAEAEADGKVKNRVNIGFCYQFLATHALLKQKDEAKAKDLFTKLLAIDSTNTAAKNYFNPPVAPVAPATPAKAGATPKQAAPPAKKPTVKKK
jgi:tetratricopeptide (TPR) repeat protein